MASMEVDVKEEASTSKLHVDNASRSVWLLKVPNFVAKRWRADCQRAAKFMDGAPVELGRVRITKNATESSGISLQLAPSVEGALPQNYSLREQTESITPTLVFADLAGRLSTEGRVKRKFDLVMKQAQGDMDPEYRRLNRERSAQAAAKTRTMQVIADPRSGGAGGDPVRAAAVGQRISFSNKGERPKKKFERGQFERRARMERDALESLLFRLFERQSLWTFVQLQKETDQPDVWLKEVLGEIGILNKRGPNAKLWELKKEYKGGGGGAGQDAAMADAS